MSSGIKKQATVQSSITELKYTTMSVAGMTIHLASTVSAAYIKFKKIKLWSDKVAKSEGKAVLNILSVTREFCKI